MHFPSEKSLAELQASGELDEALGLYANALLVPENRQTAGQFVRQYLDLQKGDRVLDHVTLRKAVFHLVFHENLLKDSTIEVYWDIVAKFGQQNKSVCIDYIQSAPRAVPLKLGRLLLYKAEFADEDRHFTTVEDFEATVLIFFSVDRICENITPDMTSQLSRLSRSTTRNANKVSRKLLDIVEAVKPGGEASKLRALFPQLELPQALYLLRDLGGADQVSEIMLDEPQKIEAMLENRRSVAHSGGSDFVQLDDSEKERQVERLRDFNRQNFRYEYVSMEEEDDEDPLEGERDSEGEGTEELSQADKKLVALEEELWAFWQSDRALFDTSARKSRERDAMRKNLGWTNEQIEGWGKVVGRRGKGQDSGLNEVESYAPRRDTKPNKRPEPKKKTEPKHEPKSEAKSESGPKPDSKKKTESKPDSRKPDAKRPEKKEKPREKQKDFKARKSGKKSTNS